HLWSAEADEEHQGQRRQQYDPAQTGKRIAARGLGEEQLGEGWRARRKPGCQASEPKAHQHVIVDTEHIGPEALIDRAVRCRAVAPNPIVVFGHNGDSPENLWSHGPRLISVFAPPTSRHGPRFALNAN